MNRCFPYQTLALVLALFCGVLGCQAQPSTEQFTLRALEETEAGARLYGPGTARKHDYALFQAMEPTLDVPDVYEVTVLREPPRYGVGVAEPKAWAWFVRRAQDDGRVLNEGLVRMAFFQGSEFHITHYSSPAELEAATRWAYPEPVEAWLADYLGFSR